jgi:hypothetical protein
LKCPYPAFAPQELHPTELPQSLSGQEWLVFAIRAGLQSLENEDRLHFGEGQLQAEGQVIEFHK